MSDFGAFLHYKPQDTNPKNSSRVYFACHPNDFPQYFNETYEDILDAGNRSGVTLTFWYRDPELEISGSDREALLTQLDGMQLLVTPVTESLLSDPDAVLSLEIAYAKERNIPILPLLSDQQLIEEYSQPENFGDTQFLSKSIADADALPFNKKLADFLSSVLVGDEVRKKVQAAFDAYIFLSYRKKDRAAAQELMRLIHKNDFCRDIAIWYDEFLVPGENFTEAIKSALKKSELFALVVTPNITEPENYVLKHEYPMAVEANKKILPLESIKTDREALKAGFKDLPEVTDAHDPAVLSEALLENLRELAIRENDTPEHNYLIALAYLHGIDVEVDHQKAEELMLSSAESGLPEAMTTLYSMYKNGKGVARDYAKSLSWLEKACDVYIQRTLADPKAHRDALIDTLTKLAESYHNLGYHKKCERYAREAIMYCRFAFKENSDPKYASEALKNAFERISAQIAIWVKENNDSSIEDSSRYSLDLYLELEKLYDEFGVPQGQSETLDALMGSAYSQISVYYSALKEREKAESYRQKAETYIDIPSVVSDITAQMFDMLSSNSLDYNKYFELVDQMIAYYKSEVDKLATAQKQSYIEEMILAGSSIIVTTESLTKQIYDTKADDLPQLLEKVHSIMGKWNSIIGQYDTDMAGNVPLDSLASVYDSMCNIAHLCDNEAEVEHFNALHYKLAKQSFDLYPTEKSLEKMAVAANTFCSFKLPSESTLNILHEVENAFSLVYRDGEPPAERTTYISTIYELTMLTYEALGDFENAYIYAEKLYGIARKKFRHTGKFSDELFMISCHLSVFEYKIKSEDDYYSLVDPFKSIISRCAEFINQPQKFGISQKDYTEVCVNYCNAMFMQAIAYSDGGNDEQAESNLNECYNVAKQILPRCTETQQAGLQEKMALIENYFNGDDEEE